MNDRYLYRAKRTDNGKWAIGYLSRPHSTNAEKGVESYYFNAIDKEGFCSQCIVSADTICQCTGLKDKNGKLIWENDIVKHYNNSNFPEQYDIGVIQWDDIKIRFKRTTIMSEECVCIRSSCIYEDIGSAIDNPELLEVGE